MFLALRSAVAASARIVESRITVGDCRTRILEVPGSGPLVLLLHGFADSADTWRELLAELARRGHRAVAIDLPGFGRASAVGRVDLLAEYDEFVTAALVSLRRADDAPAVLVGNSMGATVALRAAGDRPDVAAVVALAPAGLGFHPVLHKASNALDTLVPVLRVAYHVPYPAIGVRVAVAGYYRARLAPGLRNAWRFGSHFHGMADFRRVGALGRRLMAEVQAGCLDFGAMSAPVTLIWGSADPVCDVAGASTLLDAVPGSRLVMLHGSGHLPQIDATVAVADVLDGVVEQLAD